MLEVVKHPSPPGKEAHDDGSIRRPAGRGNGPAPARRSVLVRMTGDGRKLETARIDNSPTALRAVLARAGKNPATPT